VLRGFSRLTFRIGLRMISPLRKILHNRPAVFTTVALVGVCTAVIRLASVAKELLVAQTFGVSDALDAFFLAFIIPTVAMNVIGGSFPLAVLPTYIHMRERESEEAAEKLFANVLTWSLSLLIGLTLILAVAFPLIVPFLGGSFSQQKIELTTRLFYIVLPVIFFNGLAVVWMSALNARGHFLLAALNPIASPLLISITLIVASRRYGVYALALSTAAGAAIEMLVVGFASWRDGKTVRPRWHGFDAPTRKVIGQYLPMAAGALMSSGAALVDQWWAALLGGGNLSALAFGGRVAGLVVNIASTAIGTAVLPEFSRLVAREDWRTLHRRLRHVAGFILITTFPLTLLLFAFSPIIVRLLFQRGAFTATDAVLVSSIQRAYVWQIPFFLLAIVGIRLLSSLSKNRVLMVMSAINLGVDIVLNAILSKYWGVVGIAMSTSLVHLISVVMMYTVIWRSTRENVAREP
jgi:putative peptidoglycan lipid II flippase